MVNPLAILGLGIFGVFFIYSAQLSVGGTNWIIQLIWLTGGAAIYVTVSLIDYRFWLSVAHWFYGLAMLQLTTAHRQTDDRRTSGLPIVLRSAAVPASKEVLTPSRVIRSN